MVSSFSLAHGEASGVSTWVTHFQARPHSSPAPTSSHELAAYAGLVPTTRSSGGKTTHGGLGKASNRWLKWILVEIVVTLKLAPGPVGTYYRHLLRAKGKPKAQAAAARKLCCYLFWMLKRGWTYDEWLQQHVNSQRSEVREVARDLLAATPVEDSPRIARARRTLDACLSKAGR